jgi:hypothetical protein
MGRCCTKRDECGLVPSSSIRGYVLGCYCGIKLLAYLKVREFSYSLWNYSLFNVSQYRDYTTGCIFEEACFDSQQEEEFFLFSKLSSQVLRHIESPTQGITAKFSQE